MDKISDFSIGDRVFVKEEVRSSIANNQLEHLNKQSVRCCLREVISITETKDGFFYKLSDIKTFGSRTVVPEDSLIGEDELSGYAIRFSAQRLNDLVLVLTVPACGGD